MNVWDYFKLAYGKNKGLCRLILYPFTLLFTMPVRLFQTLINCIPLLDGKWKNYGTQFNAFFAINNLFYDFFATICEKHGRYGTTSLLGLGNYDISKFYFHTLPSLYALKSLRCVLPLLGMLAWLLSFIIWTTQFDVITVSIVIIIVLFSSMFYATTFALQTYHVVGWLFFPLGIYALQGEHWYIAAAAWIAMSFGSFPAVFMAGLLCLCLSIWGLDIAPILTIIPAALKLSHAFLKSCRKNGIKNSVVPLVNAMGFAKIKIKYPLSTKSFFKSILKEDCIYWFILCAQFNLVIYWTSGRVDPYLAISNIILLINFAKFRFHDELTVFMLYFTAGTVAAITNFHPLILFSFWIYASPLPYFLHMPPTRKTPHNRVMDIVPVYGPVNISKTLTDITSFFSVIKSGSRVLYATEFYGSGYAGVMGRHRHHFQAFKNIAVELNISLMPDDLACIEYNKKGDPDISSTDVKVVKKLVQTTRCSYVLTPIEQKHQQQWWQDTALTEISRFSMSSHSVLTEGWLGIHPSTDWVLLEVPIDFSNDAGVSKS